MHVVSKMKSLIHTHKHLFLTTKLSLIQLPKSLFILSTMKTCWITSIMLCNILIKLHILHAILSQYYYVNSHQMLYLEYSKCNIVMYNEMHNLAIAKLQLVCSPSSSVVVVAHPADPPGKSVTVMTQQV